MNTRAPLLLFATLALSFAPVVAQSNDQEERLAASFVLALGRVPTAGEIEQWSKAGKLSIAELVSRLNPSDAAARRTLVVKAGVDAFGLPPMSAEIAMRSAGNRTYAECMKQHLAWLAEHPKDYLLVVERSYQLVMQRPAYAEELDYWKAQPPLSFVLLNACIENWARRNAPGLMATSGVATASVNSRWLAAVRLSPAVAADARAAAGLPPAGNADQAAAVGRNIIAAGGGAVVSAGGINFVAAGR